jgi:DNA-binding NtrC family response regulator
MADRPASRHLEEKARGLATAPDPLYLGPAPGGLQELPCGTERILLVDDEKLLLELLGELLGRFGYTPLFAENGERALEVLNAERGRIDMVLLDLSMPGMGGFRCLQKIRVLYPDLRVLIASGYAANRKVGEALKWGAVGFVAKPFNHALILRKIRDVLDGENLGRLERGGP